MPDPGAGRLVRLSAFGVAGISWRPIRLAVDTLHPHVCSLCGMIPKSTLLLPCTHALCETCKAGNVQSGTGGVCPLDQESFEDEECSKIPLAARKIKSLKAYCWNREQGCPFVDTLQGVLRHYEEECSFHAVDCPRCGDNVRHTDLVTHYKAGCKSATASKKAAKKPQQDEGIVQVSDVKAALEEFKTLLKETYKDQLPALRSQLDKLAAEMTKQNLDQPRTLNQISKDVYELRSQLETAISQLKNNFDEEESWDRRTPVPWHLEERHILRKLELFADESLAYLEDTRQAAVQHLAHPTIRLDRFSTFAGTERCGLGRHCWLMWREDWSERLNYEFIVKNVGQIFLHASTGRELVVEVAQWHWRDVYFSVALVKNGPKDSLDVCFRFAATLESSRTDWKVSSVELKNCDGKGRRKMVRVDEAELQRDGAFQWDHIFRISLSELKNRNFVNGGDMKMIACVDT